MEKSKNLEQKINNQNYNNQQNKIIQNDNEIIIELEISNNEKEKEKEINILCDKDQLIKDNKKYENYYKKNNINPPKEFNYFNKDNSKLFLNDKEIEFNYKLKFNEIGIKKIKIKSNTKLSSLSSMFYNCNNIMNINFIKININNTKLYLNNEEIEFNYKLKFYKIGINNVKIKSNIKLFSLSTMFYNCYNIINIKFIKFNTNNVTDMSEMFYNCSNLSELNLSSFNTNNGY